MEKPLKRKLIKPIQMRKPKKGKKQPTKSTEPPKKRGRPSKADIAAREALKLAQENELKEKLRQAQQAGTSDVPPVTNGKVKNAQVPPIPVPSYRIFKVEDRVQQVDGVLIPTVERKKGRVTRQDLESKFVHVVWDDGTATWTDGVCIELEPLKVRKARAKQPTV